ncbi:MAG: response regulator [bacterium]
MARPTVLIVDDDREVTQYLSDIFKGEGWKVLCEQDGDWAIKTFKSRRIDAVILDVLIPVLNGFQVADAIRADPKGKDLPIVIMSGMYRGTENRQEAIERYGLLEYLNKPVEGDRVCRLLKEALGKRSAEQPKGRADPRLSTARPTPRPGELTGGREVRPAPPEPKVLPRPKVALRGSLEQVSFALLLHELYKLQASGALFLMRGSVKKIVYLDNGQPVFIKSNKRSETLGQQLVAQGKITEEQRKETYRLAKAGKQLHGRALAARGILTPEELQLALADQLEVKLCEIFAWPTGEFQFKENARIPDSERKVQSSAATLIVRGIARFVASERLEKELAPSLNTYPAPAGDPFLRFQWLELDADTAAVAEIVDGGRPLGQILLDSRFDRRRVSRLVSGLYNAGVIDFWDREQNLPPIRSAARRRELFGGESHLGPSDPQVEEHLAAELVRLKKLDHFRVLGVERSVDSADVEGAFDRLAWRYHPDVFLGCKREVRDLAEGVFNRFRAAYLVLSSTFRRAGYLEQLGGQVSGEADGVSEEGRRHFQDALGHLGKGRYEKAVWHLRRAVDFEEHSATYFAHLGWAVHKTSPTDHMANQEARRHLERAIQLDPSLDTSYLYFGYLHLAEEEIERARESFQKALRLNPQCDEAADQLKAITV